MTVPFLPEPPWKSRHGSTQEGIRANDPRRDPLEFSTAYALMRERYGHQGWWPGETPFEVCVGAILTQNTAWTNVEKAIRQLKAAGALEPRSMWDTPTAELSQLIRSAGYFNVKARRLRAFLEVLLDNHGGSLPGLFAGATAVVRERLLAIPGIGPETADSMMLYAGGHEVFVVDAYTRRIFLRHGWCGIESSYDALQARVVGDSAVPRGMTRLDYWQDLHAQLVMVGKTSCRPGEARCEGCPLRPLLHPCEAAACGARRPPEAGAR